MFSRNCEFLDVFNAFRYRTQFRPMYKIAYKTLTELEWRCCPGYQGHDCMEVKDLKRLQVERMPPSPFASGHIPVPEGEKSTMNICETNVYSLKNVKKKALIYLFPIPPSEAPDQRTENQGNHPWGGEGQFGGQAGQRPQSGHGGSQSEQHLEEEVQRLSQMVLDMQARMTDMSSNLRLDFQEDASKMLATLLNNFRQPSSARGAESHIAQVQDFSFGSETTQMDEVMNKISQVTDDLESKSNALDNLLGRVNSHDGQINLLMEAAQNQLPTPAPAPPTSGADLRAYLDEKISALREELMEGMDIKIADMKNACDYKITSVQEQCEGTETNYLSLAELMESKEADLRKEIQDLKTQLIGPGNADTGLVDIHLNSSEKTSASQCLSVEVKLKQEQAEAIKDLRDTLEDKLFSMEERLTTMLANTSTNSPSGGLLNVVENIQQDFQSCRTAVDAVESSLKAHIDGAMEGQLPNIEHVHSELSYLKGRVGILEDSLSDVVNQQFQASLILNSTWGQVKTGAEQEARDLLEQHQELRTHLDELRREVNAGADHCKGQTEDVGQEIARIDSRIVSVESLCGKLDPMSSSLQRIKEALNKHVTGLWTCVKHLNGTVSAHARDIGGLRGTCENIQNQISNAATDLQVLTNSNTGKTGKRLC